ncbi:MAG: L,D-transpeptidase [Devosia sp.]|nr:L,D-transpeptidase [Devosia sp.]
MLRRLLIAVLFALISSPVFAGGIAVVVNIHTQTMSVMVNGIDRYEWLVSTGRKGYRTPVGTFRPTRMEAVYYSRKYDNAPMPYAIFFYGGFAIHGTEYVRSLGGPVSHGCVRLHPSNAALLYSLVQRYGPENTVIRIEG